MHATALAALALVLAFAPLARGGTLEVRLSDGAKQPLTDAVVSLYPADAHAAALPPAQPAIMDQRDKQFVPYVLAVQRGTSVHFPNSDQIRHHVYSFSEPKRFELRLYKDTPSEPVLFDKPGTVVLGCNIHDQMISFVRVVETPWFARSDADGLARVDGVPAGRYRAELWHPRSAGGNPLERAVEIGEGQPAQLEAALELGPEIVHGKKRRGLRDRGKREDSDAP